MDIGLKHEIEETRGAERYKFGDDGTLVSSIRVTAPVVVGQRKEKLSSAWSLRNTCPWLIGVSNQSKNHQLRVIRERQSVEQKVALAEGETANTRRRIVVKSEPVAVTTQEAVDGSCEMRIVSVEQSELGNIMELSIMGQALKWARRSNLSGGLSQSTADGWNLKNHIPLTVARPFREKTRVSMLIVTIREGEERGICSAALKEMLRLVRDQIEERSVVVE